MQTTDEQIYASSLKQLGIFQKKLAEAPFPPRKKSLFQTQFFYLLQYLVISEGKTLEQANAADIKNWLNPCIGFEEHDERIDMLRFIQSFTNYPAINQPYQSGSRFWRKLYELIFWGQRLRRIWRQTRHYFDSISQEDILAAEARCAPFYRAYQELYDAVEHSGVFLESDKEVCDIVRHALQGSPVHSIVDIGCGSGRLLATLAHFFPEAKLNGTSIFAFSEEQTKELQAKKINPIYTTASSTELPDASQDVVVSTEVLEHLRHPEEMIREVSRILRPGGVFCITAPGCIASMYGKNPLSYLAIAVGTIFPSVLPPFHNLYSPLTKIPLVHYGFEANALQKMAQQHFAEVHFITSRFVSFKKFRLENLAPRLPILKKMGGLCILYGRR